MYSLSDYFDTPAEQHTLPEFWHRITERYCADETGQIEQLIALAPHSPNAQALAREWLQTTRQQERSVFDPATILSQFSLSSDEGLALMSMAEALLRIPDSRTASALLEDKLNSADWEAALDSQRDMLLNTTIWGIALSRQLTSHADPDSLLGAVAQRLGRPVLLRAVKAIIEGLGDNFVFAQDIGSACVKRYDHDSRYCDFSFDMLGEAALTEQDAQRYLTAYLEAIESVATTPDAPDTTISIKLSALHPRFENLKSRRVFHELTERVLQLLVTARTYNIGITLDAEEADRLELTLTLFKELMRTDLCKGWGKLGLAVQAYGKRALPVLGWLEALAREQDTPIPLRLVKGAYWDSEIKHAQQLGLADYPVYTLKAGTDLSYLVCARYLLSPQCNYLQPEFATHNALTVAQIAQMPTTRRFQFQRLHGMGEALYEAVCRNTGARCRIYAPIGPHQELLPYLVRRLLENGANSSFVFKAQNPAHPLETLLRTPLEQLTQHNPLRARNIPLPTDIYKPHRANSAGLNMGSTSALQALKSQMEPYLHLQWQAGPVVCGSRQEGLSTHPLFSPADIEHQIGTLAVCSDAQIRDAIRAGASAWPGWRDTNIQTRTEILDRYAGLLQQHQAELIQLCMLEAGKTLRDAVDEIREAIDFCHYYSALGAKLLRPQALPSVTGESNVLSLLGRGVFLCVSPWNFPLAIFTGQIAAALVTGNAVLAKPSSRTSLIATRATELWFQAGLPTDILQLLPYSGSEHTAILLQDSRLCGVVFTGSTATAADLFSGLARRLGAPLPVLIAETGGINAMIADSSALIEQIVKDAIRSAFASAGQRCSALRVLYVQEEIADAVTDKLKGAMDELKVGDPRHFDTDIGPIIDRQALYALHEHIETWRLKGRILHELPQTPDQASGYYVPPTLIRLHTLEELGEETFGPVLHLIRYPAERLAQVIEEINRCGYGLTLGIHSRNSATITQITDQAQVGNIYVNRDQIGAVVGSQPFGGMNLSGTGPKAGGPHYLLRFVQEKTITQNTTASGGNRDLLMADDE
jgi:RHH-type proline utilization regulon transcriptional repressor/proline dehydrogenase/delta 1-pyrroline-5-carboxylate dehydrogenase